jgi:seryl-tRNA synthetase
MTGRQALIDLPAAIPEELVADVNDKLAYANMHLEHWEIAADRSRVSIHVDDPAALADAALCVRNTVDALVRGYRAVEKDIVWRRPSRARSHCAPIWDQLVQSGLVHREAPGCVSLLGDACRVALALDRRFEAMANAFGAEPHQYPTLLPIATLERCDYFSSFPHHVTFAPHLVEDVDRIRRVGDAESFVRAGAIASALATPTHVMSPSVCFHTYAALADSRVPANRTFTAVQRCYRWESVHFATLERLWDFTMREIVFVGDPTWVEYQRQHAIVETTRLVEALDLEAWIETANDPFFVGNFAAKRYFQLLRQAKLELRLALPYAESSLAAASFNVHEDFFGRSFEIRADEKRFASTGCVGFGVERWVWALFAQHGSRVDDWPAGVRDGLRL